jgi:Tol biopolymer transport system component
MISIVLSALFAVLAATGAAEIASVTAVRDSYPHLSPDGRALVFHSNRTGAQAIWVSNADGSNAEHTPLDRERRLVTTGSDERRDSGKPDSENGKFEVGHIASFAVSMPD